jgi:hypothetical protein
VPARVSLLVALDDLGRPHARRIGVAPGLPEGAPLPEKVPALIERHLELSRRLRFDSFASPAASRPQSSCSSATIYSIVEWICASSSDVAIRASVLLDADRSTKRRAVAVDSG